MIPQANERFNKITANYVTSEVHSMSPSIQRLHVLVAGLAIESVCDVACGAGHLALSFAGKASRIVAVDAAPAMLEAVRRLAAEKGCPVETWHAFAESLPLPSAEYDLVMSRLAPHHFDDIDKAIAEMARIVRPGGCLAIIDLEGDPDPQYDAFNHRLEVLHDPTHVRSYTADRWRSIVEGAGLEIFAFEPKSTERPGGVPLHRWCEIASSGEEAERELDGLLRNAPPGALEALGIRQDSVTFHVPVRTLLLVARKPQ